MPPAERTTRTSFARILAVTALADREGATYAEICNRHYRGSTDVERAVEIVTRSATSIASAEAPGWARELVGGITADFEAGLRPLSAFQRLRDIGSGFDTAGRPVNVPSRLPNTGSSGAAWVGESGYIPVTQGKIGSARLTPKKVAGIAPFTNELRETSTSQIERVLQAIISADLAELIDATLTDDQPASELRPAGLLADATILPSVDMETDLAGLAALMVQAKAAVPALILNPARLVTVWSNPAYGPGLPDRLGPFQLIPTYYVDPGTLIALDAAAFASLMVAPDVSAGKSATLTMANADAIAPTQAIDTSGDIFTPGLVLHDGGINVAGGPSGTGTENYVAMSMFQQAATALRVVVPLDWAMMRPDAVAAVTGAAW